MAADTYIDRYSTVATDPLRSFRFKVEFTAVDSTFDTRLTTSSGAALSAGKSNGFVGGFTSVSGLNITTQSIQYREGGYNTTIHQVPGMTTFTPITLQRGVLYGNDQGITWMRGLFATSSGDGIAAGTAAGKGFRVDMKIYVMDHPNATANNIPRMGFQVKNAWCTQLSYTDLNANDGAILFESMTLVHEGLAVFFTDAEYKAADNRTALNG